MLIALIVGAVGGCSQRHAALRDYVRGRLAADQGHVRQALRELTQAIARNPQMVPAYEARADIYRHAGKYRRAAADYRRAFDLNPWSFYAAYELGVMYQQLRQFPRAIRAYQYALQIRPHSPRAALHVAVAYAQAGNPAFGIIYARRAVADGGHSFKTWANLGVIYAQAAAQNAAYRPRAIHYLKRSLELQPHQPRVYLDLAQMYLAQKRFHAAARILRTAQKLAPSALVSERTGYCYYRLGRLAAAAAAYQNALKLNPHYTPALNGLGVVDMTQYIDNRSMTVRRGQALTLWKKSLGLDANQPLIRKLVERFTPGYGKSPR
jgi:tetratricopeptide (TPR) repeat protein